MLPCGESRFSVFLRPCPRLCLESTLFPYSVSTEQTVGSLILSSPTESVSGKNEPAKAKVRLRHRWQGVLNSSVRSRVEWSLLHTKTY